VHDSWGNPPNDNAKATRVAYLAWLALIDQNYLPGVERLTAGSDGDFWLQGIRGSTAVENWAFKKVPQGMPAPENYDVIRAARVPYVVQSKGRPTDTNRYLDHLLVGYTAKISSLPANATTVAWQPGGGSSDLQALGKFLTVSLCPVDAQHPITLLSIAGWEGPYDAMNNPYGYFAPPAPSYDERPEWKFRELTIRVDKVLRISVGAEVDGARELRYLLVGYEGGGGW
jgi:hypothetical protein